MRKLFYVVIALWLTGVTGSFAQESESVPVMDYSFPKEYEIGGITVSGVQFLDKNILVQLSGLQVGETILVPGEMLTAAIEKLWSQGLFSDVKITKTSIEGNKIFLDIYLGERPRLSRFSFSGVNRNETQDLQEKIQIFTGSQVTENLLKTILLKRASTTWRWISPSAMTQNYPTLLFLT